jgi:hypothetical protein
MKKLMITVAALLISTAAMAASNPPTQLSRYMVWWER